MAIPTFPGHAAPWSERGADRCLQDMHYAEFAEDEVCGSGDANADSNHLTSRQSAALLAAIKEYEASKWKVIGQKLGKPAKVSGARLSHEFVDGPVSNCLAPHRPVNSMPKSILGARIEAMAQWTGVAWVLGTA